MRSLSFSSTRARYTLTVLGEIASSSAISESLRPEAISRSVWNSRSESSSWGFRDSGSARLAAIDSATSGVM